jgi:DNA repair photolyase
MLAEEAAVADPQRDWGNYLLYRDDLPERLHEGLETHDFEDWKTTDRGRGVVMLSSGTDCYQDRRAAQITRSCVHELIEHEIPTRILTRSPNVTRDIDLFTQADAHLTVGTSIPSFDTSLVRAIEPNAPPPMARWNALDALFRAGVSRFVSFSPTYPTMDGDDIERALSWFSAIDPEVVFHEPINPRGVNFEMCIEAVREAGYEQAAQKFEQLTEQDAWVEYALEQIDLVQQKAEAFGNLTIHSWPDRKLVEATSGELRRQLKRMQQTVSTEAFGTGLSDPAPAQGPLVRDANAWE